MSRINNLQKHSDFALQSKYITVMVMYSIVRQTCRIHRSDLKSGFLLQEKKKKNKQLTVSRLDTAFCAKAALTPESQG